MTGRPSRGRGSGARQDERLTALLEPVVSEAGFELESVKVSQAGRRKVVKLIVDGDNGVSLDDVATISRGASQALDSLDDGFGSDPYTLEVSSPGVDRPLTTERHWRRATGRLVRFTEEGKVCEARVTSVDGDRVTLEQNGADRTVPIADVSPARVQVEFNNKRTGTRE